VSHDFHTSPIVCDEDQRCRARSRRVQRTDIPSSENAPSDGSARACVRAHASASRHGLSGVDAATDRACLRASRPHVAAVSDAPLHQASRRRCAVVDEILNPMPTGSSDRQKATARKQGRPRQSPRRGFSFFWLKLTGDDNRYRLSKAQTRRNDLEVYVKFTGRMEG